MEKMKNVKTKAVALAICVAMLVAMSGVSLASTGAKVEYGPEENPDIYSNAEVITESTTENPHEVPKIVGVVHWDFEITNPDQISYPGGEAHYEMRITNAPDSTDRLYLSGFLISFVPPLPRDYGDWDFDIDWDALSEGIAPGDTYVGPFGHFIWSDAVPVGWMQGGDMVVYADTPASPLDISVPYTCAIVYPGPRVSISTDSFEYAPGDTMTITLDVSTEESVMFQWYWGVPRFSVWVPVMSAPIPAGYDDTVDLRFTIPNWGPTPFGNVFYVQLLDAGGEVLDADCEGWAYMQLRGAEGEVLDVDCECWCKWAYMQLHDAGGEAMPAVDIGEEIMETIERVELP